MSTQEPDFIRFLRDEFSEPMPSSSFDGTHLRIGDGENAGSIVAEVRSIPEARTVVFRVVKCVGLNQKTVWFFFSRLVALYDRNVWEHQIPDEDVTLCAVVEYA